jgi:CDP-diacylglycerol pyrophosphatase
VHRWVILLTNRLLGSELTRLCLSDAAIGVLQVTIFDARGLKGAKIGGGTPDPYVSLTINNRAEMARTRYKHSTWVDSSICFAATVTHAIYLDITLTGVKSSS